MPRAGTLDDVTPRRMLLDECERVLPLLRSPVLTERWAEPSALQHWSNGGLAGHLARSAFNLERAAGREPRGGPAHDAVSYYAASPAQPPGSAIGTRIRELGDREAAGGAAALAGRFAASVASLRESVLPVDAATMVEMFGQVLPVDECATACLLELIVHADDLAVSLELEPVEFSEPAVDLVVVTLSRIARKRHGDLAVIRSMSRPERSGAHGIGVF
jgi:Mycothiol maleylpyruvate isomerase N-terminal domain